MSENGISASDVMALTRGNDIFGGSIGGILGLLIIAGIFGNGGFFGNGNNNTSMWDNFIERDIFNTNTNVLNTANATQTAIQGAKYDTAINVLQSTNALQNNVLENRYANELGFANTQKDILLGNQNMLSQMAQCCCDLKTTVHAEGEATRALINQNRISELEYQLSQANTAVSNAVQTQNLLSNLGRFVPYGTTYYGTTIQ